MPEKELVYSHNGDHPYEQHVIALISGYLAAQSFPVKRIKVMVTFSPTLSSFSKHKLDLELVGPKPSGQVELIYNSLFLVQDPMNFFETVVPHEVAHVLNEISAYKTGVEVQEHGLEWAEWLEKLSDKAEPAASLPDTEFDNRAIILNNGGVLATCDCEGNERYHAYRNSGAKVADLRRGNVECKQCGSTLVISDVSELPNSIRSDIEFIKQDLKERNT